MLYSIRFGPKRLLATPHTNVIVGYPTDDSQTHSFRVTSCRQNHYVWGNYVQEMVADNNRTGSTLAI